MKIISESPNRNHMMCVYHNVGPDGKVYSVTRHQPINPLKPCIQRKFLGKKVN